MTLPGSWVGLQRVGQGVLIAFGFFCGCLVRRLLKDRKHESYKEGE